MVFYIVDDVQSILGISRSKAYQVMQSLNNELEKMGFITLSGKIPKKFFDERLYCDGAEKTKGEGL